MHRHSSVFLLSLLFLFTACGRYAPADQLPDPNGQQLSRELLLNLKNGRPTEANLSAIAALDPDELVYELDTREEQLAFWINIYNGMAQHLLTSQPDLWDSRNNFFSTPRFTVAAEKLSLEDVEHGIIRGGEAKLGLGFIPQLFPGKFKRTFKIQGGDPRIHFALNCGAIDCPPVEIYDSESVDERLDHRTRVYLSKHSQLSEDGKTLVTTPLLSWFRGDFRTYDGVDDFLVYFGVLTEDNKSVNRDYKDYDWTLATDVYAED